MSTIGHRPRSRDFKIFEPPRTHKRTGTHYIRDRPISSLSFQHSSLSSKMVYCFCFECRLSGSRKDVDGACLLSTISYARARTNVIQHYTPAPQTYTHADPPAPPTHRPWALGPGSLAWYFCKGISKHLKHQFNQRRFNSQVCYSLFCIITWLF